MLSVGNASVGAASTPPLETRGTVASGILRTEAQVDTAAPVPAETFRTHTFVAYKLVYRQDYGKTVLREQDAATGEEIAQIPSEYHLQQYAATQRAQRQTQQHNLSQGSSSGLKAGTTSVRASGTANASTAPTEAPAPQSSPAPVQVSAPAPQAAPAAHVDIKV